MTRSEKMADTQRAVAAVMRDMGFDGEHLPLCQYTVPGTFMTVDFDLSAVQPDNVLAGVIGQAYRAGWERGMVAQQGEIRRALGIRD